MFFCQSCGGILVPKKEGEKSYLECRQCKSKFENQGIELKVQERRELTEEINVNRKIENLPKIKQDCVKCDNNMAYWWTMQTRASDEPETRFFKCTKCGHVWREYD